MGVGREAELEARGSARERERAGPDREGHAVLLLLGGDLPGEGIDAGLRPLGHVLGEARREHGDFATKEVQVRKVNEGRRGILGLAGRG